MCHSSSGFAELLLSRFIILCSFNCVSQRHFVPSIHVLFQPKYMTQPFVTRWSIMNRLFNYNNCHNSDHWPNPWARMAQRCQIATLSTNVALDVRHSVAAGISASSRAVEWTTNGTAAGSICISLATNITSTPVVCNIQIPCIWLIPRLARRPNVPIVKFYLADISVATAVCISINLESTCSSNWGCKGDCDSNNRGGPHFVSHKICLEVKFKISILHWETKGWLLTVAK